MNSTADTFFPPRAERGEREVVLAHFPFPLAVTYARLQDEMDRQEPVAAAWQLRDAFECALKFCACVAVADFLQADPEKEQAERLVGLLFKPNGLSLGDWHTLVEMALEPLTPLAREDRLGESRRSLPALYHVFFTAAARRAKRSKLNLDIDGSQDAFVAWRNRVFGHGVFQQERAWYAAETLAWLPRLHALYDALGPVLQGWALRTEGAEHPPWQGLPQGWPTVEHEHEPLGEPAPLVLRPVLSDGKPLSLGPLLSVQTCAVCQQPAVFFFDRNRYERKKDRHKTKFLEYFRGHSAELRDWPPVSGLARNLPTEFEWQRSSYDKLEVVEGKEIVFRDFESEYLRPDYLVDAVWELVEEGDKGYIHIVGPGGVAKTYLARGLEEVEGAEHGVPVLAHYFQGGATTGHQTFIVELGQRAYERLRFQTPQIQGKGTSRAALQAEFAAFLAELKAANRLHTLIVVLDALDELPEPEASKPSIADYLPAPADLPEGCFLVLTGRERLSPRVQANLDGLRADRERYRSLSLEPAAEPQREILRAYLREHLPVAFRKPEHIETVLARGQGLFLYAYHLTHALSSGAFTDTADLPEAPAFYPTYLERLRDRVGEDLYRQVYLPTLLFLCAARAPVTLSQLERWGVPGDRLRSALLELRDFVWEQRVLGWHEAAGDEPGEKRYAIAHDGFTRYVAEEPVLQQELIQTHIRILLVALSDNAGHWQDLDVSEAEALYDLRFAIGHEDLLARIGVLETNLPVSGNPDYGYACLERGTELVERDRHGIAVALLANAARVFEHQIRDLGRVEFQPDLALTRMNQGNALSSLGDGQGALGAYAEAEGLYRELIAAGRGEFQPNLTDAIMSRGRIFDQLGQSEDALACHQESVALLRALMAQGLDVGDVLAQVLVDQSLSLVDLERFQEALQVAEEAATTVAENASEGTSEEPRVFEIRGCRALTLIGLKEWSSAAGAIAAAWEGLTSTVGMEEMLTEPPFPWNWVRADLRELSETDRARLYDALGSIRKQVQDWVESE